MNTMIHMDIWEKGTPDMSSSRWVLDDFHRLIYLNTWAPDETVLGGIRSCGLVDGIMPLEVGFEALKAHASPVHSLCLLILDHL